MAFCLFRTHHLASVRTCERLDLAIVADQVTRRHSATSPIQEVAVLFRSGPDIQWVTCPIQAVRHQLEHMAAEVSKVVPSPVQHAIVLPAEWPALTAGIRLRHWDLLETLLELQLQCSPLGPSVLRTFHHFLRPQRHQVLAAGVVLQCDSRIRLYHLETTQPAVDPQQTLVSSLGVAEAML